VTPELRETLATQLGVAEVPAESIERLAAYLDLLARWRGAVDLVGRLSPAQLVMGPIRETVVGLPFVPTQGRLLDIGSGAGLPAVPLLIFRSGLSGVLLEPRERRWAFLKEVVRELGLDAEVRRETLASHRGVGYDAVTVRAVAAGSWTPDITKVLSSQGLLLWWTAADKARAWRPPVPDGRVVLSALPAESPTLLLVWQRCST
jgi:16S rRNA G527 N7-methylase RsmG